jgi:putative hydroxymethylpyrimidine transport system substrate-binding protein
LGGLLALASIDVQTLDRLAGRKIGYSLAPLEPVLWGTVLDCVGVDPSSMTWVNVGYSSMAALVAGHVDAIGAFRNYERLQLEELGYEAVFFPQEEYCVPMTWELVLVCHPALVEERGEGVAAFVRALERGIDWTVDNPGEAAVIFFSRFPDLDDALNRRSFEETRSLYARGSSYGDERIWEELQRYLVEHELMDLEFPVAELYVLHPAACP